MLRHLAVRENSDFAAKISCMGGPWAYICVVPETEQSGETAFRPLLFS
jgi:hypothetical protein